jgi:hypothetical protein
MGRKRGGRPRAGRGGMMSSMRGGFRSAVRGVTGSGGKTPSNTSPTKRFLWNLVNIALVVAVAVLLLRRFGVLR